MSCDIFAIGFDLGEQVGTVFLLVPIYCRQKIRATFFQKKREGDDESDEF